MRVLYVEPFEGGSHAAFTRTLTEGLDLDWTLATLPGRHWKWRMRGSGVYFAAQSELWEAPHDLLFASAFLPLIELMGLRPEIAKIPRVLYFHENQLAYPMPKGAAKRDFHFGFTQLVSCLGATRCVFNSEYNKRSFLDLGQKLLSRYPDSIPPGWIEQVESKSQVIPVPLRLPLLPDALFDDPKEGREEGPIILWNHRWEYDKNPEHFFKVLFRLQEEGIPFRLIVCGESFRKQPPIFEIAKEQLASHILHWGYAESRRDYEALLNRSHIAVSTANHEFFGIAALEATHHGAYPLVPDRLSYREIFPSKHRYRKDRDLLPRLHLLCSRWSKGEMELRKKRREICEPFEEQRVLSQFQGLFEELLEDGASGQLGH